MLLVNMKIYPSKNIPFVRLLLYPSYAYSYTLRTPTPIPFVRLLLVNVELLAHRLLVYGAKYLVYELLGDAHSLGLSLGSK